MRIINYGTRAKRENMMRESYFLFKPEHVIRIPNSELLLSLLFVGPLRENDGERKKENEI